MRSKGYREQRYAERDTELCQNRVTEPWQNRAPELRMHVADETAERL